MAGYENQMRKLLDGDKPIYGTNINIRDPLVSDLLGRIYDFLWIDGEHSFLSDGDIFNHILAAKAAGAASLVRIPWNDPVLAKPILEMGPDGIIFPMVCNKDEARAAIDACLYPPYGHRGWGPIRSIDYGALNPQEYVSSLPNRIYKVIQIETYYAVDALEEILCVDGIDCVCV